jgi:glycosyltransferase involved in cell wall biosynthesis
VKEWLKQLVFRLLEKDPEAVVVSFWSGEPERARRMFEEVRALLPERRHFIVALEYVDSNEATLVQVPERDAILHVRRYFARYRIGLAPLLFDGGEHPLRAAAFALAPRRILAYNGRLERHHLRLSTAIASILFLRGIPLDRIFLRPSWLYPFKRDRTRIPDEIVTVQGRECSAARPKVGILSPYFPYPLTHGGAVRIFHLLREAAKDFDLFLFTFARGARGQEFGPLLEFCAEVSVAELPHYREPRWSTLAPPEVGEYESPPLRKCIENAQKRHKIALFQVEYTHLAHYPGDVLVEHDITQDLYRQVYLKDGTAAAWANWRRWKCFEDRALRRYRRVVVMSKKDAAFTNRSVVIENGVDLQRFQPGPQPPEPGLLFVGSFNHFPNVQAFRFFYESVWPLLGKNLRWTVVAGRDHRAYWDQFTGNAPFPEDEHVIVHDFVRDVRPMYIDTWIVIVPTLVSAGTNLKVLEAMAMERAIVSTPSGCAGIGLEDGSSVRIASGPREFAAAIEELLSDHCQRRRLAQNARRLAEQRFDWVEIGKKQATLWKELLRPS